jgi:uncharacterized membrane protein (DUF2068 family)
MANSSNNSMHVLTETSPETGVPAVHDRGLLAIAIFKLAKSLFFFCLGMGAIHFLHKDLGDAVLQLAKALRFDPESRAVGLVLDKVDLIGPLRLREISMATFAYSALALTEGVGLLLERTWAEYLTLILTVSFVPWEMYELILHPSWIRVAVFVVNLAVLWYLIWLLKRKGTFTRRRVR